MLLNFKEAVEISTEASPIKLPVTVLTCKEQVYLRQCAAHPLYLLDADTAASLAWWCRVVLVVFCLQ